MRQGAMANLTELWLNSNQIGDLGMTALSEALAIGLGTVQDARPLMEQDR